MKVAILGSTGSIGTSTLKVISRHPARFEVVALGAGKNVPLLAEQIQAFRPRLVCLSDKDSARELQSLLSGPDAPEVMAGAEGMRAVATFPDADMVVAAISGAAGLLPTLSAVKAGKAIALANKEALVMAGELIMGEASRSRCKIIPVDSEHSAIYQLLQGHAPQAVRNIILTASGGPFLNYTKEQLQRVTPGEALKHPRWKMGYKVTTDSASLMNKGLEIIEAHWLFGFSVEQIKVVIHPQSIVHSMVEFVDGTVFAQMAEPDMQAPIAYALSCPERLRDIVAPLDFAKMGSLTFSVPDVERFPSLRLAYDALAEGGLMPCVMNAANEVAVNKFHDRSLGFLAISSLTGKVMERFSNDRSITLENILWADQWAREESEKVLREIAQ